MFSYARLRETSVWPSVGTGASSQDYPVSPRTLCSTYVLYTADIPHSKHIFLANFTDDTDVLAPHADYNTAINTLQSVVSEIIDYTKRWKIQIKSVKVEFALRPYQPAHIYVNN